MARMKHVPVQDDTVSGPRRRAHARTASAAVSLAASHVTSADPSQTPACAREFNATQNSIVVSEESKPGLLQRKQPGQQELQGRPDSPAVQQWEDPQLTQLAGCYTNDGETVALSQAFCSCCGIYLADVCGSSEDRTVHIAMCRVKEAEQEQQQQQHTRKPYSSAEIGSDAPDTILFSDGDDDEDDCNLVTELNCAEPSQPGTNKRPMHASSINNNLSNEHPDSHSPRKRVSGNNSRRDNSALDPNPISVEDSTAVHNWLCTLDLGIHATAFADAGICLAQLPALSDSALIRLGIATLGRRKKFLAAAMQLHSKGNHSSDIEPPAAARDSSSCCMQPFEAEACSDSTPRIGAAERTPLQELQPLQYHHNAKHQLLQQNVNVPLGHQHQSRCQDGGGAPRRHITDFFEPPGGRRQPVPTLQPLQGGITTEPKQPHTIDTFFKGSLSGTTSGDETQHNRSTASAPAAVELTDAAHNGVLTAAQTTVATAALGAAVAALKLRNGAWLPDWQQVPQLRLVVDKFGPATNDFPATAWFLTHFHADHYGGLTRKWCTKNQGLIYCTTPTAKLASDRLKVPWARLACIPLHKPFTVTTLEAHGRTWRPIEVTCTFLEANHCPGAVMVLFKAPGHPPVLHTGDCRWQPGPDPQRDEFLGPVRGRLQLILDTTYCQPLYDFPPQAEVIRFAVDAVRAEAFNAKTLFLFGSYTIGKERLFLEVARQLSMKVYVSVAKRKALSALDLRPQYAKWLTVNEGEARIQAVTLGMTSFKAMASVAKHYRGRFTTIVGFRPTGWSMPGKTPVGGSQKKAARGSRSQKGNLVSYQVPYSEHSSFSELRDCIRQLRPVRIIPSVGNDRGPKTQRMLSLLTKQ